MPSKPGGCAACTVAITAPLATAEADDIRLPLTRSSVFLTGSPRILLPAAQDGRRPSSQLESIVLRPATMDLIAAPPSTPDEECRVSRSAIVPKSHEPSAGVEGFDQLSHSLCS